MCVCRSLATELLDTRAARPFSFAFNTSDYRILLMDQDQGRLYLGSREYLVALDMQNVNKEPLIVSPLCLAAVALPPSAAVSARSVVLFSLGRMVRMEGRCEVCARFNCSCASSNADPLAGVCEKKGRMSDDRKGKTGMIMFLLFVFFPAAFSLMGICVCVCAVRRKESARIPLWCLTSIRPSLCCRVNVPTLCG